MENLNQHSNSILSTITEREGRKHMFAPTIVATRISNGCSSNIQISIRPKSSQPAVPYRHSLHNKALIFPPFYFKC